MKKKTKMRWKDGNNGKDMLRDERFYFQIAFTNTIAISESLKSSKVCIKSTVSFLCMIT